MKEDKTQIEDQAKKDKDETVVPEKNEDKSKTSVGEIVGYTTSLVSIIALIKSL